MEKVDLPWDQLGALLVEKKLLTAADLERALAEQRRTGRLLGQILVVQGFLTASELARALAGHDGAEPKAAGEKEATRTAGRDWPWMPLGSLLVRKGLVTERELQEALLEKRRHQNRRLGEILVERGCLSAEELASALAEQDGAEAEPAAPAAGTE